MTGRGSRQAEGARSFPYLQKTRKCQKSRPVVSRLIPLLLDGRKPYRYAAAPSVIVGRAQDNDLPHQAVRTDTWDAQAPDTGNIFYGDVYAAG